jgi:ankyrin repeat protein
MGYNALMLIIMKNKSFDLESIESILNKTTKINATDIFGKTALFYASESGNIDIVKMILQKQQNMMQIDGNDMTEDQINKAIDVANKKDKPEIAKAIKDHFKKTIGSEESVPQSVLGKASGGALEESSTQSKKPRNGP